MHTCHSVYEHYNRDYYHVMTSSCRVLTHRPKRVKKKTTGSDYIIENALATPWPHEDTALDIDKPRQSINLQPMHSEEDRYIQ